MNNFLKEHLSPENLEKLDKYEMDEIVWYSVRSLDRDNPKAKWIVWGSLEYELCDISDEDRIDKDFILEHVIRYLMVEDNQHLDICVFHEADERDSEYVRVHYGAIQWLKRYYFNHQNADFTKKEIKDMKKRGADFIKDSHYFSTQPIGTAKELNDWFLYLNDNNRIVQIYNGEYGIEKVL